MSPDPPAVRVPSPLQPVGPGSVAWRVVGDRRLTLAAGAGLLLQVAHPVIGAGVHDHSTFTADPWGRLDRSIDSLMTQVFGGEQAIVEGQRLRELHKPIKGVDAHGDRYHALDPEVYWWVHASVFWTVRRAVAVFGCPLTDVEQRGLYAEWRRIGVILGLHEQRMPVDIEGFRAYFDDMVAHRLEDNRTVRELLQSLTLRDVPPPQWWPLPGGAWGALSPMGGTVLSLTTIGLLPPVLRDRLGLDWTDRHEQGLRLLAAAVRVAGPVLPSRLRLYPIAYDALRRAAG
jgi:Uncharacterized protein conserved in bacteria